MYLLTFFYRITRWVVDLVGTYRLCSFHEPMTCGCIEVPSKADFIVGWTHICLNTRETTVCDLIDMRWKKNNNNKLKITHKSITYRSYVKKALINDVINMNNFDIYVCIIYTYVTDMSLIRMNSGLSFNWWKWTNISYLFAEVWGLAHCPSNALHSNCVVTFVLIVASEFNNDCY